MFGSKFDKRKFEGELRDWFEAHIIRKDSGTPANGLFYAQHYLQTLPAEKRLAAIEKDILRNQLFLDYFGNLSHHLAVALDVLERHVPEKDGAAFGEIKNAILYTGTVQLPETELSEAIPADVLFNNLFNWSAKSKDGITFVSVSAPVLANGRALVTAFGLAADHSSLTQPLKDFFSALSQGDQPSWVKRAASTTLEILEHPEPICRIG